MTGQLSVPLTPAPCQVSQEIEECHERLPVDDLAVQEAVQKQSSMGWASSQSTGDNLLAAFPQDAK